MTTKGRHTTDVDVQTRYHPSGDEYSWAVATCEDCDWTAEGDDADVRDKASTHERSTAEGMLDDPVARADREQPEDVPIPPCECGLAPGEPCDQCENPGSREQPEGAVVGTAEGDIKVDWSSREQPAGLRTLLPWLRHGQGCAIYSHPWLGRRVEGAPDCDCGLDAALAAALPEGRE
jgi:hypothetical protein